MLCSKVSRRDNPDFAGINLEHIFNFYRKCMCDKNENKWLEDHGYINDTDMLPLRRVKFGDTGSNYEEAYHTVGPLRCYEGRSFLTFIN